MSSHADRSRPREIARRYWQNQAGPWPSPSARNVESMYGFYTRAPKVMTRIGPRDVGERRIGHFGFFRQRYESSLWRPIFLPAIALSKKRLASRCARV